LIDFKIDKNLLYMLIFENKITLSEKQMLCLFAWYANEEGTIFLHSGDHKGTSWLALGYKNKINSHCWLEAKEFLDKAQTYCFGYFPYEKEGLYTLYEPSILLKYDHIKNEASVFGKWELPELPSMPKWKGKGSVIGRSDTKKDYLEKVEKIIEAISWGDVYQVNLSQEFLFELEGDSVALWLELVNRLSPSHSAFLNCGELQILSLSPELFVKQEGEKVTMMPIKGTLPSHLPVKQLLESEKNIAELTMIVDLYRNDLSKYAKRGSVAVAHGLFAQTFRDIHHLFAEITAKTNKRLSPITLLHSLFPAGSISGCPKEASMDFIEQLENSPRGVYTGAIGWMHPEGKMEMNVPIRTMVLKGKELSLRLGGGVVADSDPEEEYQETLAKGRSFFDVLGVKIE
jgi:anthranilate/para-aminobenzoate synthase component I